jgi:hypothetical protein
MAGKEGAGCDDDKLRLHCNLGYANLGYRPGDAIPSTCVHLPAERDFDAVRFQLQGEGSKMVRLQFACELAHRPALCGELRYDRVAESWISPPDPRLDALANAVVHAWIARRRDLGKVSRTKNANQQ